MRERRQTSSVKMSLLVPFVGRQGTGRKYRNRTVRPHNTGLSLQTLENPVCWLEMELMG